RSRSAVRRWTWRSVAKNCSSPARVTGPSTSSIFPGVVPSAASAPAQVVNASTFSRVHASVEHALLAVGVVFRLRQSDEIAEHEVVVGADAGRRSHDVAGRLGEIETRIAVSVIPHPRMAPHAELAAGAKLRIRVEAGHVTTG